MIDFRYHLVSLVSVFIALAVGIVLGAGPLRGQIASTLQTSVQNLRAEKQQLDNELKTATTGVRQRDAFSQAVMPALVSQQLGGRTVVLVTLPGSDSDAVKPLTATLETAGARVTGRIDLKDAWTSPDAAAARRKLADQWKNVLSGSTVDSIATTSASTAAAVASSPAKAPAATPSKSALSRVGVAATSAAAAPVTRSPAPSAPPSTAATPAATTDPSSRVVDDLLDAELSRALVTTELAAAETVDPTGRAILDSFAKEGLLSVDGDLNGRAASVVLLTPGVQEATLSGALSTPTGTASPVQDTSAVWTALCLALDRAGDGAVVVGPASAATSGGVISAVRSTGDVAKEVSSVDTGGSPMGDITTVLALREQLSGVAGAYGFGKGASGPLPGQAN